MPYDTPASYYAGQPQLGVPASLVSDDLLQFKGARSVIKQIPASSGSNVGPSSSILFQIPQEAHSFLIPNSCYVRGKLVVAQAGALNVLWSYAGQNGTNMAAGASVGCGGASSLFRSITATLPGGTSMSYNGSHHFRNGILPHALTKSWFTDDMRQLEGAGACRVNGVGAGEASRTAYFACPVDVPLLNGSQAVPLLLMSGGLTLEIVTSTVLEAFRSATADVTGFSISDLSLVYETCQVSPEYKQALMASAVERPFSMAVKDRVYLGSFGLGGGTRLNIGVGLSSLRAIVGTFTVASDWSSSSAAKCYSNNGMTSFHVFINGQEVTLPTLDNDSVCFAELNRALGNYNDAVITSNLLVQTNTQDSALRNNYCSHQFAFGVSCETLADPEFALCGVPADQIAVEIRCDTITASAWQNTPAAAAATLHLWALYDAVLSVNGDGTCMVRK